MRTTTIFLTAALILASFIGISCRKEMSETAEGTSVTVIGTINDNSATKVSLTEGTNAIKTAWENNDNIIGWDESGNKLELKIDGADRITSDGKAIFTLVHGTLPTVSGKKIYMIYAPGKTFSSLGTSELTYDLSSQSDKVPALMTAIGILTDGQITLNFSGVLALVAVKNPKLPVSSVTGVAGLKLSGSNVNSSVTINRSLALSPSGSGPITRTCCFTTASDGTTSGVMEYFAVAPNSALAQVTVSTLTPTGYEIIKADASFAAGDCYVLANKNVTKQVFTILTPPVSNGSFTTSPSSNAPWGNSVQVTAHPDTPSTDYELNTLSITKSGGFPVSYIGSGPYYFDMPQDNVTVSGTFRKKKYTLSLSVNDGSMGSAALNYTTGGTEITTGTAIEWGTGVTVVPTAKYDYYVWDISYSTGSGISDNTTAFSMPKCNTNVNVVFTNRSYAITKAATSHGVVTTNPFGSSPWGETVTVTATPDANYFVDGGIKVYKTGDESTTVTVETDGSFTMPKYAVTVKVTFKESTTGTIQGHNYVKMGNTKWATCNVGADSPTGYGYYFSWGNVQGYIWDGSWVNANNLTRSGRVFTETHYNSTSGSGISYYNIPANTTYDAARKNWGGTWRMPTKDEFQDLYDACVNGSYDRSTYASTACGASTTISSKGVYWCGNYDGVKGCLFYDGTNRLFFPAAGYGGDPSLTFAGTYGRYWSSTYYPYSNEQAYDLVFDSGSVNPQDNYWRELGPSVRPVSN